MLDLFFRPARALLDIAEHAVISRTPIEKTEEDILGAVQAIHRATESIEHHVEVIEGLATSVGPLTESVNHLTATMTDLVALMEPMAASEREVHHVGRFFGRHRHAQAAKPDVPGPDPSRPA